MGDSPHYFIAIPIPSSLKKWIANQQQEFIRLNQLQYKHYVDPTDFHITLLFLGYLSEEKKRGLIQELNQLMELRSFELSIGGIGYFGLQERPRVCWLGVDANSALTSLQRKIATIIENYGIEFDTRPYRPHITIAKKWQDGKLNSTKQKHIEAALSDKRCFVVDHFNLYKINSKQQPMYEIIARFS